MDRYIRIKVPRPRGRLKPRDRRDTRAAAPHYAPRVFVGSM